MLVEAGGACFGVATANCEWVGVEPAWDQELIQSVCGGEEERCVCSACEVWHTHVGGRCQRQVGEGNHCLHQQMLAPDSARLALLRCAEMVLCARWSENGVADVVRV